MMKIVGKLAGIALIIAGGAGIYNIAKTPITDATMLIQPCFLVIAGIFILKALGNQGVPQ